MMTQPDSQTRTPDRRFAALTALPPDYQLAWRLNLDSPRTVLLLNAASLIPLAISIVFFLLVDRALITLDMHPALDVPMTDESRLWLTVVGIVLVLALLVVHELCHGMAFQWFGAHPRYGINLGKGVAYASAKDYYVTRDAYLIVGLAPLVLISIGAVILMAVTGGGARFMVALLGAVNAGSSVGDIWFVAICLRYPRTLLVRDFGEGAELFSRRSGS
jgi:hypothetical protein